MRQINSLPCSRSSFAGKRANGCWPLARNLDRRAASLPDTLLPVRQVDVDVGVAAARSSIFNSARQVVRSYPGSTEAESIQALADSLGIGFGDALDNRFHNILSQNVVRA